MDIEFCNNGVTEIFQLDYVDPGYYVVTMANGRSIKDDSLTWIIRHLKAQHIYINPSNIIKLKEFTWTAILSSI